MTPAQAIALVEARIGQLGGLPEEVHLADRGDETTEAVVAWFQERGVKVILTPPPEGATTPESSARALLWRSDSVNVRHPREIASGEDKVGE